MPKCLHERLKSTAANTALPKAAKCAAFGNAYPLGGIEKTPKYSIASKSDHHAQRFLHGRTV